MIPETCGKEVLQRAKLPYQKLKKYQLDVNNNIEPSEPN